jgi:hypothetical protein
MTHRSLQEYTIDPNHSQCSFYCIMKPFNETMAQTQQPTTARRSQRSVRLNSSHPSPTDSHTHIENKGYYVESSWILPHSIETGKTNVAID